MLLDIQIAFGNIMDLNYRSGLMLCEGVEFAVADRIYRVLNKNHSIFIW